MNGNCDINDTNDIGLSVKFASELIKKYGWNKKLSKNVRSQLNAIISKQNDNLLNISVIGEFSTGKSSFINAIIGFDLLAKDVIQGTTIVITIIEFSENFSITFTDLQSRSSTKIYHSINPLREDLLRYTVDSSSAQKINCLTITLPSPTLRQGFRIIDTPGTDSLELWHKNVTKRAIKDMSDLSIIVVNAICPLPESLVSFLNNVSACNIKDSIFIVNKIDLVPIKERDSITKYVSKRADFAFDCEDTIVLPFSSVALTNNITEEKIRVDKSCVVTSKNSLQKILSYTAQARLKAQARKILLLTDIMYNDLKSIIDEITKKYDIELDIIENTKQIDLKPFIQNEIEERQKSFMKKVPETRNRIEVNYISLIDKTVEKINFSIRRKSTLDSLDHYMKNQLCNDIEGEIKTYPDIVKQEDSRIYELYKSEIEAFQSDFEKIFSKYKILPIRTNISAKSMHIKHISMSPYMESAVELTSKALSKENWSYGSAIGIGTAIGTCILPGIGTAVGFIVGAGMAAATAPNIDAVKKETIAKLETPLRSFLRRIVNNLMEEWDAHIERVCKQVKKDILQYQLTYNSKVSQQIKEWEKQHSQIKNKIRDIRKDTDRIVTIQNSIKNKILTT